MLIYSQFKNQHTCLPLINSVLFNSDMTTFNERISEAVKIAGGQTRLAEKLSARINREISQSTIRYLIHGQRDRSPPRSSELTPFIAEIVGFNTHWLATGEGDKYPAKATESGQAERQGAETTTPHHRIEDVAAPHYHARANPAAVSPAASPPHENQQLVNELLARRIPPHIQQSILILLQGCDRLGPQPELSEWDRMTAGKIEALRAAVPPEQQQVIDDFRDMFLHGYVQPGPKRDLIAVVSLDGAAADHDADDDQAPAADEKQKCPK